MDGILGCWFGDIVWLADSCSFYNKASLHRKTLWMSKLLCSSFFVDIKFLYLFYRKNILYSHILVLQTHLHIHT